MFEEVLRESRLKAGYFYHASPKLFDRFRSSSKYIKYKDKGDHNDAVFLCDNIEMCVKFAYNYLSSKNKGVEDFYLYKVKIQGDLNIFNPNNKDDRKLFLDEVRRIGQEDFLIGYEKAERAGYSATLRHTLLCILSGSFTSIENPLVIRIFRDLGFDGFYAREGEDRTLAIFDPQVISIVDTKKVSRKDMEVWWGSKPRRSEIFNIDSTRHSGLPRGFKQEELDDFDLNGRVVADRIKKGQYENYRLDHYHDEKDNEGPDWMKKYLSKWGPRGSQTQLHKVKSINKRYKKNRDTSGLFD